MESNIILFLVSWENKKSEMTQTRVSWTIFEKSLYVFPIERFQQKRYTHITYVVLRPPSEWNEILIFLHSGYVTPIWNNLTRHFTEFVPFVLCILKIYEQHGYTFIIIVSLYHIKTTSQYTKVVSNLNSIKLHWFLIILLITRLPIRYNEEVNFPYKKYYGLVIWSIIYSIFEIFLLPTSQKYELVFKL